MVHKINKENKVQDIKINIMLEINKKPNKHIKDNFNCENNTKPWQDWVNSC